MKPPRTKSAEEPAPGLVRRLVDLLRGYCIGTKAWCSAPIRMLEGWLKDARKDGAAVKAALTTSRSSGQTEGQVGQLKMLKGQTIGRSSFDLLRRRVLLTA